MGRWGQLVLEFTRALNHVVDVVQQARLLAEVGAHALAVRAEGQLHLLLKQVRLVRVVLGGAHAIFDYKSDFEIYL